MISWWERQLAQLPVTIHTGVELRADSPEIADADEVIVATGSVPIEPASIGGLDSDQVVSVLDAHNGAPLGHRVVVLGGGLSGADLALELALEGHEVTIVEMGEGLARDLIIINRMTLLRQLADHNVTVLTNHTVTQVTSGAVVATHDGQDVVIDADTVISAFGVAPNKEFQKAAQAQGRTIVAVGDCVTPAKVGEAINAGFAAACEL